MQITNQNEFLRLIKGATFLASGGGGPYFLAEKIVNDYIGSSTCNIDIVNINELDNTSWTSIAAGMAQPSKGASLTPEEIVQPTVNAVDMMTNQINKGVFSQKSDKFKSFEKFDVLTPIEVGAINVTIPLLTTYIKNQKNNGSLKVVDGDPSGRSVPTIDLSSFASTQPVMPNIATSDNNNETSTGFEFTVLSLKNYKDLGLAYSRMIEAGLIGVDTGLCLSPMTISTLKDNNIVPGTLLDAYKIGKVFEDNIMSLEKIRRVKDILENESQSKRQVKHICTGKVIEYFTKSVNDNDLGYLKIETENKRIFTILIQNENIIGQFDDETCVSVTGPDSICYISTKDGSFTADDIYDNVLIEKQLSENKEVKLHILAIQASSIITENTKLMASWKNSYNISNYFGCYYSKIWG